jgi:D-alanine-D-alanine ligase
VDFAFLLVHGPYGEDGTLQGFLEFMNIPYSGSNVYASAMCVNKILQKKILAKHCHLKPYETFSKDEWFSCNQEELFEKLKQRLGLPIVFKAPNQGSSIGINILKEDNFELFREAVHHSFFIKEIQASDWKKRSDKDKIKFLQEFCELENPVTVPAICFEEMHFEYYFEGEQLQYNPWYLSVRFNNHFTYKKTPLYVSSFDSEEFILAESFIEGQEFSCTVVRLPSGKLATFPATEIISPAANYDFKAKYTAGGSKKVIPANVSDELNDKISETVKAIFEDLGCNVYARIDGFVTPEGEIIVTDTNNIPGMSPTSLIFRQAAEVGLNPTQFLNHVVLQSMYERYLSGKKPYHGRIDYNNTAREIRKRTEDRYPAEYICFGDDANEKTYAKVREAYNYVYAMGNYIPVVIFRRGKGESAQFWQLPPSFLLRESVKAVNEDVEKELHPITLKAIENAKELLDKYAEDYFFKPIPLTLAELTAKGCKAKKLFKNHSELD